MRPTMGRKEERPGEVGRDYSTLLGMGWTPDSIDEALSIARELLSEGDGDGALAAVESARSLLGADTHEAERAGLEAVTLEVALHRGDPPRAIDAANALRAAPLSLPHGEVARLRDALSGSTVFRPELREALKRVLDAAIAASGDPRVADDRSGLLAFQAAEDELPYLDADPAVLGPEIEPPTPAGANVVGRSAEQAAEVEWLDLADGSAANPGWTPGQFLAREGEALDDLRARFLDSAAAAGTEHSLEACETGWSFFLMEDYAAALLLFDLSIGEPLVRVSAAEGAVRCRLHLSRAADAVELLERLQSLCYADGLPDALRYWYGRAAAEAGEFRKARAAYRSLPADAFPDVRSRLGDLP